MSNQRNLPYIEGERVLLRLAEEKDIPEIIDYYSRNREYLAPFEPIRSDEFYTEEYWKLICLNNQQDYFQDRSLRLFLFEKSNPVKLIGSVNFNNFVMANYMPHNRKSGEVLKRLGFVAEGYARDYLRINGKWEDHILTALTNNVGL